MPGKILIVEDNADAREMLCLLLGQEGYTVVAAEDGCSGISEAILQEPDLILTDLGMPCLSGVELIRQLRGHPGFETVPILVLTAHPNGSDTAKANVVLTKPVSLEVLLGHVRVLLDGSYSQAVPSISSRRPVTRS